MPHVVELEDIEQEQIVVRDDQQTMEQRVALSP
jgi:hypothetical protein